MMLAAAKESSVSDSKRVKKEAVFNTDLTEDTSNISKPPFAIFVKHMSGTETLYYVSPNDLVSDFLITALSMNLPFT